MDKKQLGKQLLRPLVAKLAAPSKHYMDARLCGKLLVQLLSKCPESKKLARDYVAELGSLLAHA